jgi:hypothetical protein
MNNDNQTLNLDEGKIKNLRDVRGWTKICYPDLTSSLKQEAKSLKALDAVMHFQLG